MSSLVKLVLPDVKELLAEGGRAEVAEALSGWHVADIAELTGQLESAEAAKLILLLEEPLRSETFAMLEQAQQLELAQEVGAEAMAPVVENMSADDRADFVAALSPELTSGVLKRLPDEEREEVAEFIGYEEGTAGSLMTSEYVALDPDMTVQDAIAHVRKVASEQETIYALYVVDAAEKLRGVVTMRQLILSDPAARIGEVMIAPPIAMSVEDDQESVVERLARYDFVAMPIVDADGHMLGIVTHDDVLDVAQEEATEDAQLMGGMQPLEEAYLATGLLTLVRKRAVWLSVLFFAGLGAGSVLQSFQEPLQRAVALLVFLPLIVASGGNSGSQSATLVTRGLAIGDVQTGDWFRIVRRELASGLLLGSLLGFLGTCVAHLWGLPEAGRVSLTVWLTLTATVTTGSLVGSVLPLILKRIGFDPAITSAPLVACLVDILGIWIYVHIAFLVLL